MSADTLDDTHDVVTERLLRLYRRYLGEPDQLADVYGGFGLFFGGVAMATIGMLVFLWSTTLPDQAAIHWQLREVAVSLAMLGLPAFLLGVAVLLPTDRFAVVGGGLGSLICLAAVGLFVANYPHNWNIEGADASATGVTVYAAGLVLATAAVGAALVSNYIERAEPAARGDAGGAGDQTGDGADAGESVSSEQVREDIENAMSNTDLSWGGVEKDDTRRLKIHTDESDIDRSGFDNASANEKRSAGSDVDDAVSGLQQLRGGDTEEATGEGTDQQTDALRQLREQQQQEDVEREDSVVSRLRERIGL